MKNKENTRKLKQIETRKQEIGSKVKVKEDTKWMRETHIPQFFFNYNFIFFLQRILSIFFLLGRTERTFCLWWAHCPLPDNRSINMEHYLYNN